MQDDVESTKTQKHGKQEHAGQSESQPRVVRKGFYDAGGREHHTQQADKDPNHRLRAFGRIAPGNDFPEYIAYNFTDHDISFLSESHIGL